MNKLIEFHIFMKDDKDYVKVKYYDETNQSTIERELPFEGIPNGIKLGILSYVDSMIDFLEGN